MAPAIFNRQKTSTPNRSAFDLSREQKLSCDMGFLIPTYLEEIVPGDQFRVKSEIMMRLAPLVSPVMHRVNVFMHYFFVPNRLIWNQWKEFITGGKDGEANPVYPTLDTTNLAPGRLSDYLGIPNEADMNAMNVSALPFRGYHLIWNEYYRDQNLHDEINPETMTPAELATLKKRCWEKDYFTSALPFPQRGADVGMSQNISYSDKSTVFKADSDGGGQADQGAWDLFIDTNIDPNVTEIRDSVGDTLRIENLASDQGISFTINELRESTALQRWLEKSARGGYRYIETIFSHFGVRSSDERMHRPEYLGGGKQPIVISEVLNTSATDTEPQGKMTGHGITMDATNTFQEQFEEHGYIFGIMSVLPRTAYQQGIDRHWSRRDKTDYYWPEFANLGEQEVKNKELFITGTDSDEETFGYQQRYAEYKYGKSSVHGDFRSNLDHWHMGRKFLIQPNLNESFVEMNNGPIDNRVFAAPAGDNLWVQIFHNVKARRPMPYFAEPQL